MVVSSLETLPNELFCTLFENYMDQMEFFHTFSQLNNTRLRTLANVSQKFRINFRGMRKEDFLKLLPNLDTRSDNIDSLTLSDLNTPGQINMFIKQYSGFERFTNLRSLNLEVDPHISFDKLSRYIYSLRRTNQIMNMSIRLCNYTGRTIPLELDEIFSNPTLKRVVINLQGFQEKFTFCPKTYPHIQRLTLTGLGWSFRQVSQILRKFPNLISLHMSIVRSRHRSRKEFPLTDSENISSSLRILSLNIATDVSGWSSFEVYKLLRQMPHLQKLKLNLPAKYLDGPNFQSLFEEGHMYQLESFKIIVICNPPQHFNTNSFQFLQCPTMMPTTYDLLDLLTGPLVCLHRFNNDFWKEKSYFNLFIFFEGYQIQAYESNSHESVQRYLESLLPITLILPVRTDEFSSERDTDSVKKICSPGYVEINGNANQLNSTRTLHLGILCNNRYNIFSNKIGLNNVTHLKCNCTTGMVFFYSILSALESLESLTINSDFLQDLLEIEIKDLKQFDSVKSIEVTGVDYFLHTELFKLPRLFPCVQNLRLHNFNPKRIPKDFTKLIPSIRCLSFSHSSASDWFREAKERYLCSLSDTVITIWLDDRILSDDYWEKTFRDV